MDREAWRATVHKVEKSWTGLKKLGTTMQETEETWVRFLGQEAPLEEGMATLSSILAWRIP